MFATAWKDFVNSPIVAHTQLSSMQLTAAAADMMLNSTEVWDRHYDDSNRGRGTQLVLDLWPQFVEFVKQQHLDKASEK
jgi:precorrin-6B methylase 1